MDAGQTNRSAVWSQPPRSQNGFVDLELLSAARGIMVQLLRSWPHISLTGLGNEPRHTIELIPWIQNRKRKYSKMAS